LFTFGAEGFGGCFEAGFGVGGSFEVGAQTGLPTSGFVTSGKLEIGFSPIADLAFTPNYNFSSGQGAIPLQGHVGPFQAQVDFATGEGSAGFQRRGAGSGGKGLRAAADAHFGGGACISSKW
jgi:hypothetical protein